MNAIKELQKFGFPTKNKTFVIAEIGINHGGNIETASQLIDSAARTGCDAVKFQTYLTEKRAPEGNQEIFDILKQCELPFDVFGNLKKHAEDLGLTFFSTPFDHESLECLEAIDTELYKVASFDVVNHALLREIAVTGKSVIMSVGMSKMNEILAAYKILAKHTDKISILHCISTYPLNEQDANLSVINALKNKFDCAIGYSDHTNDITVPLYAVAAGAQIIEKHFKINENMNCVDAPVSITENQMGKMILEIRRIEGIFGESKMGIREAEKEIVMFRRFSK